jgi:putative GTP pyrophosphokinase
MSEVAAQHRFVTEYEAFVRDVLDPTAAEVKAQFKWRDPVYWSKYSTDRLPAPSPVQRVHVRVKRPESAMDKIFRQPTLYPGGLSSRSFRAMTDTVGARVVVYFLSQLPLVHRELLGHPGIEISSQVPPKAYMSQELKVRLGLDLPGAVKDSGYNSVHYVIRLKDSRLPIEKRPWFELQVRTLAEDAWAEIHHVLGYKPNKRTSASFSRRSTSTSI